MQRVAMTNEFISEKPPNRWALVLFWLIPALWSSNFLLARASRGVIAPHMLALGRWVFALVLMLPFTGRELWQQRATIQREWPHLLVLGALGMWICGAFVYISAQSTTATNIALFYAATPIAISILGVRLLGERMTRTQWLAIPGALIGVLLVITHGNVSSLWHFRFVAGDGWAVSAAASWTLYSVLLQRWPSGLSPRTRIAGISAGGILVLLPFTVLERMVEPSIPFSAQAGLLVLLAAILPGALSYMAYSYLQRELGAARAALLLYLAPVYGGLGAWAVLGEQPGWYHVAGAAFILPSIGLATRNPIETPPRSYRTLQTNT